MAGCGSLLMHLARFVAKISIKFKNENKNNYIKTQCGHQRMRDWCWATFCRRFQTALEAECGIDANRRPRLAGHEVL